MHGAERHDEGKNTNMAYTCHPCRSRTAKIAPTTAITNDTLAFLFDWGLFLKTNALGNHSFETLT